jgi:hypothetical protein
LGRPEEPSSGRFFFVRQAILMREPAIFERSKTKTAGILGINRLVGVA